MRRLLLTGTAGRIATAVRAVLRELADEVVLTMGARSWAVRAPRATPAGGQCSGVAGGLVRVRQRRH